MAKEIYMNVGITEYGNGIIDCHYTESIDDGELTIKELELPHALKLMWELKLAGGVKRVRVNQFDRTIVAREVYIFLPNG
jgi:hypothetical protein